MLVCLKGGYYAKLTSWCVTSWYHVISSLKTCLKFCFDSFTYVWIFFASMQIIYGGCWNACSHLSPHLLPLPSKLSFIFICFYGCGFSAKRSFIYLYTSDFNGFIFLCFYGFNAKRSFIVINTCKRVTRRLNITKLTHFVTASEFSLVLQKTHFRGWISDHLRLVLQTSVLPFFTIMIFFRKY